MSQKRREQRRQRQAEAAGQIRWAPVLRSIVLAGAVALIVISTLVPSEAAIAFGTYAPLASAWCLLLVVWAASLWVDEKPTIALGLTEAAGAALLGWHSLAAAVSLGHTNGRQALNAHWLIFGYGLTLFLLRQVLRTAEQARALVAATLWLATLLAAVGFYQYGYGMPTARREYQQDPAKYLVANDISTEAGSTDREQFENRLNSVEPVATFGLTNSLAGFLAPWLVAAMAIGQANLHERRQRRTVMTLAIVSALIAACLVLTKSRTAYLATLAGLVLVALYGRRGGWRLDWRIPTALAGVGLVIGLIAVYFGGLDVQVLSEAPKSVLYRLEYWQATARVIAEHPIFGCGPGNFQEAYASHKLPQASEMPADPHNFLLEMWATAGTPALMLLIALLGAFALDVSMRIQLSPHTESQSDDASVAPAKWIVFGGAAAGILIAPLIATALGYPFKLLTPTPVVCLLGFALLAAAWWSFDAWFAGGELTLAAAVVPQIVLLINLLAAGSLSFPGVMATILVLAPIALLAAGQAAPADQPSPSPARMPIWRPPRAVAFVMFFGAAALAATCLYTEHYPVFNGRIAMSEALDHVAQGHPREAEDKAIAAAKADPLWPEPWRILAELRLARWQTTNDAKDWDAFTEAADMFRRLDPRHHQAWRRRGVWYLTAWRKSSRPEELNEAISAFTRASNWYPNGALYHAQLAWALHLSGNAAAARREAEKALELDKLMPHKDKKLDREHIADPQFSGEQVKPFREESAEQTAQRLRKQSAEEMQ
jgi:tetratricopeptide (TPR) repeat protein